MQHTNVMLLEWSERDNVSPDGDHADNMLPILFVAAEYGDNYQQTNE